MILISIFLDLDYEDNKNNDQDMMDTDFLDCEIPPPKHQDTEYDRNSTNQTLSQELKYQMVLEKLFANIKKFPELDAILSNKTNNSPDTKTSINAPNQQENLKTCQADHFQNHRDKQLFTSQLHKSK